MLYCPCWGSMLLELLFFAPMRRFTLQTGIAIFAMLWVYLAFPCGAVAQDGQSADSSTELVAATAHHTGALAQQTSADPPPAPAAAAPEPQSSDALTLFPHSETSRYWISGQANIVLQWHGRFPAAYSGTNSLKPVPENATSKVYTLFLGYELTHTTEVYLDVESAGGHGLSNALGLAGFTNLDVVRNPSLGDVPYLARLMLRQIIPLSKERVAVERGPLALATSLPARRLEFRLGKFTIPDFFDANTYGTDSHLQFLNWTVDNDGAYDYAANTRGYTDGAILE
jgi:high affinity Mn2+ porin